MPSASRAMSPHRHLRRIVIAVPKVTAVEATMEGRGWVGRGRREGGGGAVLMMAKATRGVNTAMDMTTEKRAQKQREMHMRRYLGGKELVLVVVGSKKMRRRREQWKLLPERVAWHNIITGMTQNTITTARKNDYPKRRCGYKWMGCTTYHVMSCHDHHSYNYLSIYHMHACIMTIPWAKHGTML